MTYLLGYYIKWEFENISVSRLITHHWPHWPLSQSFINSLFLLNRLLKLSDQLLSNFIWGFYRVGNLKSLQLVPDCWLRVMPTDSKKNIKNLLKRKIGNMKLDIKHYGDEFFQSLSSWLSIVLLKGQTEWFSSMLLYRKHINILFLKLMCSLFHNKMRTWKYIFFKVSRKFWTFFSKSQEFTFWKRLL